MVKKIFDRAGYAYLLSPLPVGDNYVTFSWDGAPVVVRNGKEVKSTFFHDGEGRWAKLINSADPAKIEKVLKKKENPAIVMKDGEIVSQFVPLTGIVWHDEKGNKFFLISRYEREELEADHLPYVTASSEGNYESLIYYAYDGEKEIPCPGHLYNEKNRKFIVGVNIKAMAYEVMRKRGNASIAIKNALRPVFARPSDEGEFIMAHTFGAYEAGEKGSGKGWIVDYCEGGNGGWEVPNEEFFKRYEIFSVAEDGRAIFIAKAARFVWCHLLGDYIFCIPQWGDSMVAMSNPQVNITNPNDVYACSYIEFFGKEDIPGGYIIVEQLFLGAPEFAVLEFAETFAGYLETSFGIPKSTITASNLSNYLKETLGVPDIDGVQAKVTAAVEVG